MTKEKISKDIEASLHEVTIQVISNGYLIRKQVSKEAEEGKTMGIGYSTQKMFVAENMTSLMNILEKIFRPQGSYD